MICEKPRISRFSNTNLSQVFSFSIRGLRCKLQSSKFRLKKSGGLDSQACWIDQFGVLVPLNQARSPQHFMSGVRDWLRGTRFLVEGNAVFRRTPVYPATRVHYLKGARKIKLWFRYIETHPDNPAVCFSM